MEMEILKVNNKIADRLDQLNRNMGPNSFTGKNHIFPMYMLEAIKNDLKSEGLTKLKIRYRGPRVPGFYTRPDTGHTYYRDAYDCQSTAVKGQANGFVVYAYINGSLTPMFPKHGKGLPWWVLQVAR
jgi:hypothetical protein